MKICLLTYNSPHKKTAQVFMGLHNRGVRQLDLLLMPFTQRPPRPVALSHRPHQFEGPHPGSLAAMGNGRLWDYADWRKALEENDHFIVCGSNIIEPEFANSGKVLNVHSGLIPNVRGLDSFKWSILLQRPMGNTLHRIDQEADAGEVLHQLSTPLFNEDDLSTFAARHYENEIWMLTNFDKLMHRKVTIPGLPLEPPTKRMPAGTEAEMVRSFGKYKSKFALNSRTRH